MRTSVIVLGLSVLMLITPMLRTDWTALWPDLSPIPEVAAPVAVAATNRLTLSIEGTTRGDMVAVLVNGKAVATFGSGQVTLMVSEGDYIEIDSTLDQRVRVIVASSSSEILLPRAGDFVSVQNTLEALGRITIRRRNG